MTLTCLPSTGPASTSNDGDGLAERRQKRPTLYEATLAAVDRLGFRYFTGTGTTRGEEWLAIIVDWLPVWTLPEETDLQTLWHMERWSTQVFTPIREEKYARCNQIERLELVEQALVALTPKDAPGNISDSYMGHWYTDDHRGMPKLDPIHAALVAGWWDARMSEGHSPASARLLLELTLPPTIARRLTFTESADGTEDGTGPTLTPFVPEPA